MKRKSRSQILSLVALSVGAFLLFAGPEGCQDTLQMVGGSAVAVERYWRLTMALNELNLNEWKEKVNAANSADAGKGFAAKEQEISQEYDRKRAGLYGEFGTTAAEYHGFASRHKEEVENYYKNDPMLQQQLESLQQQIRLEIDRYDAAARGKRAL